MVWIPRRAQYEPSRVTDAPFTTRTTLDPSCNKARPGHAWTQITLKVHPAPGVNASHYGTIGFFGLIIPNGDQYTHFGQFIKSPPFMHIKEESDRGHHCIHIHVEIEKYWWCGHLNFNTTADVSHVRIKISDETFSCDLIWQFIQIPENTFPPVHWNRQWPVTNTGCSLTS